MRDSDDVEKASLGTTLAKYRNSNAYSTLRMGSRAHFSPELGNVSADKDVAHDLSSRPDLLFIRRRCVRIEKQLRGNDFRAQHMSAEPKVGVQPMSRMTGNRDSRCTSHCFANGTLAPIIVDAIIRVDAILCH